MGSSGNPGFPSTVRGFASLSGGLPTGNFANAGDAPGLFFHGTADPIVPSRWSDLTTAAMLDAGVPAWLQHQDGAGHVPYAQYRSLYLEQMDYFFYLTLDLAHAAGQPVAAARAYGRQLRAHGHEPERQAAAAPAAAAAPDGEARAGASPLGRRARRCCRA